MVSRKDSRAMGRKDSRPRKQRRVVGSMGHPLTPYEVIETPGMTKEKSKSLIATFLRSTPGMDQLDIAEALCVPLKFACEVCDEMVKEGKIKVVKS